MYKIIIKKKRDLEKGNERGLHEKQCISDCTIAVCVCVWPLAQCTYHIF